MRFDNGICESGRPLHDTDGQNGEAPIAADIQQAAGKIPLTLAT